MQVKLDQHNFLVLGLGKSGIAAARWLSARQAKVSAADSMLDAAGFEALQPTLPNVALIAGEFSDALLADIDVIVISPGIALDSPIIVAAKAKDIAVIGDVELFAQFCPARSSIIGITGSNGKTTVTTLVGKICEAAGLNVVVAGNIGLPVMEAIDQAAPNVFVLELSSFQLETTQSLKLHAATMLNLSQDHMDRHADMQAYAIAKARIFYHAAVQVLNLDDAWSMVMARSGVKQHCFGLQPSMSEQDLGLLEIDGEMWIARGDEALMPVCNIKLIGAHNVANVMAAILLCIPIGIAQSTIVETISEFLGLPHRVQWVTSHQEVDYINDSKATNVGAAVAAIEGLAQDIVLIAGGEGKGQDFAPLAGVANKLNAVVLIGKDAAKIESVLLSEEVAMYHAADMHEAVTIAQKMAKAGDAVLLSPACASFDMYQNYEQRGDAFTEAVMRLTEAGEVSK